MTVGSSGGLTADGWLREADENEVRREEGPEVSTSASVLDVGDWVRMIGDDGVAESALPRSRFGISAEV